MSKAATHIKQKPDLMYPLLLMLLVPVIYFKVFSAGFISWDDKEVLLGNMDVHTFNMKAFFTKHYVGNYAPLTMIGFAIDWMLFRGDAFWQHSINLLFHAINVFLVFRLSRMLLGDSLKAFFVALVFCMHPTQVETVAWVAAKNNLVYSLFFIWSLILYVRYVKEGGWKFLATSFLMYVLSALSKPSAICLPLVLFAMDYLLGKPLTFKTLLQKVPFFIVSLIIGIVTIYSRTEDKFINDTHHYAIYERIGYAGYALFFYLFKFIAPLRLSVIYPYPQQTLMALIGGGIMLTGVLVWFGIFLRKKQYERAGALLFIVSNLILVLQFIPFGEVIAADRYMYLPLIGFALLVLSVLKLSASRLRIACAVLLVVYGVLTFSRVAVWKNSIALYSDIVDKYPDSFLALNSLGAEYMLHGDAGKALPYMNKAIAIAPQYYKGYYNRGLLFAQTGHYTEALADFTKAIDLKQYIKAYVGRGNVYYTMHDIPKAKADAEKALAIEPNNPKALFLMGRCYDDINELDKAMTSYNTCLQANPEDAMILLRRAILFGKKQDFRSCVSDLDACIRFQPDYAEAYYWRGVARANLHQNPCADLTQAYQKGFTGARGALEKYCH
ncbi:MAG: tetratricopeptide repeat protein [Bacteroidetes bacterium]|nr:tetratricopeptide repeat protein [Bacteroidota bacterium]